MEITDYDDYSFYARTPQGYVIKNIIELYDANFTSDGLFDLTDQGIFSSCTDKEFDKLFDVSLHREKFLDYKCDAPMYIGFKLKLFLSHIKEVKKKDSLALFTKKDKPNMLGIEIIPRNADTNKRAVSYITYYPIVKPIKTTIDKSVYNNPHVMVSSEFQRVCKQLNAIKGKIVKIAIQDSNYICFSVDNGLATKEMMYGKKTVDKPKTESFELVYITQLTKLCQMTTMINISYSEMKGYPLKINSGAGDLGEITVFIKDKVQSALEKKRQKSDNRPHT